MVGWDTAWYVSGDEAVKLRIGVGSQRVVGEVLLPAQCGSGGQSAAWIPVESKDPQRYLIP
jgi:hypothetical protein